jgi:hypothetical protein
MALEKPNGNFKKYKDGKRTKEENVAFSFIFWSEVLRVINVFLMSIFSPFKIDMIFKIIIISKFERHVSIGKTQ